MKRSNKLGIKGIELRGRIYWCDIGINGTRLRRSLKTSNLSEAKSRLDAIREKYSRMTSFTFNISENFTPSKEEVIRLLMGAKERARVKNIDCELTASSVELIIARSAGFCEVTGIEFTRSNSNQWRRAPFAPSIDRIDSRKPYTVKNCRVVCTAVNIALSDWGEAVFKEIAKAYCKKNYEF